MNLPDFDVVFDTQAHRLQGIGSWHDVPLLGTDNARALLRLARESAHRLMASGGDVAERRGIKAAIDFLEGCLADALHKPLLPRLRVESFRVGDAVRIYLGDTPGAVSSAWASATITVVDKAFRPDWNDGSANGGYFWRWAATADVPLFPGENTARFSTSEPRVVKTWEYDYLRGGTDPAFVAIFAANACRTWQPLWCLERGVTVDGAAMRYEKWLHENG